MFCKITTWKVTGWKILHTLCLIISGFLMMYINTLTPVFIHNYINPVYLCGFMPLLISISLHIHHVYPTDPTLPIYYNKVDVCPEV